MSLKTTEQKQLQQRLEALIGLASEVKLTDTVCPLLASQLAEMCVFLSAATSIADELETSVRQYLVRERKPE